MKPRAEYLPKLPPLFGLPIMKYEAEHNFRYGKTKFDGFQDNHPFMDDRVDQARMDFVERNAPSDEELQAKKPGDYDPFDFGMTTKLTRFGRGGPLGVVDVSGISLKMIDQEDFTTIILGFIYGMQYEQGKGPGNCYKSIELNIVLINEMLGYFNSFWLPANWTKIVKSSKNLNDIIASLTKYC